MIAIIGDTDTSLAAYAKSLYPSAVHITDHQTQNEVYFSLGDMAIKDFLAYLLDADQIIYHNKLAPWSHADLKSITEHVLYLIHLIWPTRPINGFDAESFVYVENPICGHDLDSVFRSRVDVQKICRFDTLNYHGLMDIRRACAPQIWVAGCSYADGRDLEDRNLRYGQLVANHFRSACSFLTFHGSSLDWAVDQLIRSDIRPDDLVILGITALERYSWFVHDRLVNMNAHNVTLQEEKSFYRRMLLDDARCQLAERLINQAVAVCAKNQAQLVLIGHLSLSGKTNAEKFRGFLRQHHCYLDIESCMGDRYPGQLDSRFNLDLASDGFHPGTQTHAAWAEIIIDFIKSIHGHHKFYKVDQ